MAGPVCKLIDNTQLAGIVPQEPVGALDQGGSLEPVSPPVPELGLGSPFGFGAPWGYRVPSKRATEVCATEGGGVDVKDSSVPIFAYLASPVHVSGEGKLTQEVCAMATGHGWRFMNDGFLVSYGSWSERQCSVKNLGSVSPTKVAELRALLGVPKTPDK